MEATGGMIIATTTTIIIGPVLPSAPTAPTVPIVQTARGHLGRRNCLLEDNRFSPLKNYQIPCVVFGLLSFIPKASSAFYFENGSY